MADIEWYPDKASHVNRFMTTLSSSHRRGVIHYFESRPEADTSSLDAIASHLDGRMPSTSQAEVEAALHHMHLPKMAESGWVDYEPDERRIHYHGKEEAETWLSEVAGVFSE